MKTCSKCKCSKPESEFGKCSKVRNNLRSECRQCKNADDRRYRQSSEGRTTIKKNRQRQRKNGTTKAWHEKYPLAQDAHRQIRTAIERESINRPDCCDRCHRAHSRLNAHHEDYSQPLLVEWLCPSCHVTTHKQVNIA